MTQTAFILILTADAERGGRLRELLRKRHGHSCHVVTDLKEALESIRQRMPDVVVTERRLDGVDTVAPLAELLDRPNRNAALLILGELEPKPATQLLEITALKDKGDLDDLADAIGRTAARVVTLREDRLLKKSLEEHQAEIFHGIVGVSPAIRHIVERIKKIARTKLTVLILGETGTGKELIAQAIHMSSDRANRPIKELNCAGFNENLLESTLFGHVKGAFTGAVADQKGYFVAADGGTLFLDEIGDMPLVMQAKLLRALEQREITPVGSTDTRKVDVRLIAATNTDPHKLVEEKKFREDLYYRLNQCVIEVPPLRERREDIPLLADHLLRRANRTHGVHTTGISSAAMQQLTRYYWQGNVRELNNVIETLAVEVGDRQIEVEDLPEAIRGSRALVPASVGNFAGLPLAEMERMMIERTLSATGGNREQAAKLLGIGTRTLYRKIKEYGLN